MSGPSTREPTRLVSLADRPHHGVNFGSFGRACGKVHVAEPVPRPEWPKKADDWQAIAGLATTATLHRWALQTAFQPVLRVWLECANASQP